MQALKLVGDNWVPNGASKQARCIQDTERVNEWCVLREQPED
jgi:hypothetical protein